MSKIDEVFIDFSLKLVELADDSVGVDEILKFNTPGIILGILKEAACGDKTLDHLSLAICKFSLLHDDVRRSIIQAGGISTCRRLINERKTTRSVIYSLMMLVSLAQLHEYMANFNKALEDVLLLLDNEVETLSTERSTPLSDAILEYALLALCNFIKGNDSNRSLVTSSQVPNHLKIIIDKRKDNCRILAAAANLICNATYRNQYSSRRFLECQSFSSLVNIISDRPGDSTVDTDLFLGVMMACSNLSNDEAIISTGVIDEVGRLLQSCDDAQILKRAALACASMSYKSTESRRLFGKSGCVEALVDIVLRMGLLNESDEEKEDAKAAEASSWALVALLKDKRNAQILNEDMEDLKGLVELYLQTESSQCLIAGAMVISVLLPLQEEKEVLIEEGRKSPVEYAGGGGVLERCRDEYQIVQNVHPSWLTAALAVVKINEISGGDTHQCKSGRDKNDEDEERLAAKLDPVEYFTQDQLFHEITASVGKDDFLFDLKCD